MSRDPGPGIRSERNAAFFGAQPQHVVSALAQQRMERQAFRGTHDRIACQRESSLE